jgi:hypothetical protein
MKEDKIVATVEKMGAILIAAVVIVTIAGGMGLAVAVGLVLGLYGLAVLLAIAIDGQREMAKKQEEILDLLKSRQAVPKAPEKEEETAQTPIVQ